MNDLARAQLARDNCLKASAILDELQKNGIWIHSRVETALKLVREANSALQTLSRSLICGEKDRQQRSEHP